MEEYDTVFFFPFTGEQTREAKDDKKQQFSYILGVPYRPILPFLCSNKLFVKEGDADLLCSQNVQCGSNI